MFAFRHCSFSYAMYKSLNDPSLNLIDGVSIEQYVMMETIANTLRITINFPCIGRFKFNLYGRDLDSKVGILILFFGTMETNCNV